MSKSITTKKPKCASNLMMAPPRKSATLRHTVRSLNDKTLSPDTKTKATNNKLQLTNIDPTLVKKHSGPRVTPALTMSNRRQKLTSIDAMFSKKRREQQGRSNSSPAVTETFVVTNDVWVQTSWQRCGGGGGGGVFPG